MKPISLDNVFPRGEIGARSSLLASRLETAIYRPDRIFSVEGGGWPADWEGRTILALTLINNSTKKEPAYLEEIIEGVKSHLNERGYFGHICAGNDVDEQQLSGHSWLLRGLCEYYKLTADAEVYDIICGIMENLFLPAGTAYDTYPIFRETSEGGAESGNIALKIGRWHLSTDTGCAYIPLDGVSAVYELALMPAPENAPRVLSVKNIGDMLDVMIINFCFLDIKALKLQTHATLTACRGILRTYEVKHMLGAEVSTLLERVSNIFDTYVSYGMTANYANYNWFGRPNWTEPCAIIDSFIVAMQLYMYKNDIKYLSYAQKILYNGIGHAQRPNGGFGCDTCASAAAGSDSSDVRNSSVLGIHCYEAYWCCTMRGGEGMARAAQYSYLITDENTITIPYLTSSVAVFDIAGGKIKICQTSDYPNNGRSRFNILENTVHDTVRLRIYLPEWAKNVHIDGAENKITPSYAFIKLVPETKEISLSFDIPLYSAHPDGCCNDGEKYLACYGNLVMGIKNPVDDSVKALDIAAAEYTPSAERGCVPLFTCGKTILEPINTLYMLSQNEAENVKYKILFD